MMSNEEEHLRTGRLHVHGVCNSHTEDGRLMAELADNKNGRRFEVEISIDDHPSLKAKWRDLCGALEGAATTIMLDMVGIGEIPDTLPAPPSVYPRCRICDKQEESNVMVNGKGYCLDHVPSSSE
jgi:hypothetical protein